MSDSQFGILIATLATFLSGVIGMLKWAAGRIVKALDDNTASNVKDADAKIELAKQMAVLSTKIDAVADWVSEHTPPARPIPQGYYSERPKTGGR